MPVHKQHYAHIGETIYSEKLDNGLSVFLLPKKEMAKTYSIFSTNYGSIDQTFVPIGKQEKITVPEGIAHFLEHKLFEKKDRDVFADFSKQGASANAFTSFTKTAYLFSATSQIEKNVETLLDFVQEPYFSDESVEKEKGIIAQEIKMYDDQPEWQAFMSALKAMFAHHPVHIDIAGTVESISKITKEDLYTCYETFYHPDNMTLFIAGNFDVDTMMDLIKTNQEKKQFRKTDAIIREYPEEPPEVYQKEKKVTMAVSVPKCTIGIKEYVKELDKEAYLKKEMLTNIVLDYLFSKGGAFYEKLYEENLIDESFYFETNLEKNFGYSLIGTNTNNPDAFSRRCKELLLSTASLPVTEEDVERMKRKKIGQLLRSMNSLEFIANKFIHYRQQDISFFDLIPFVQTLTLADVREFLKNWIQEEKLSVCTIMNE